MSKPSDLTPSLERLTLEATELLAALVACPSVTPDDTDAQKILGEYLQKHTPLIERTHTQAHGIRNLYVQTGEGAKVLLLAGHTDVVPVGDEALWHSNPWQLTAQKGALIGRGVEDMKGGLAAMAVAAKYAFQDPKTSALCLIWLITGDEEGDALEGTAAMVRSLQDKGKRFPAALIGEPSSQASVGDSIRMGRRGSLHATLVFHAQPQHVAYIGGGLNPLHEAVRAGAALSELVFEDGDAKAPATSLSITALQSDSGASNVTPSSASMRVAIRTSPLSSIESIQARAQEALEKAGIQGHQIHWRISAKPFASKPGGPLAALLQEVVGQVCGIQPDFNAGGGTSDGRFLIDLCEEVMELGLINQTLHQPNEAISSADLGRLTQVYLALFKRYAEVF